MCTQIQEEHRTNLGQAHPKGFIPNPKEEALRRRGREQTQRGPRWVRSSEITGTWAEGRRLQS